MKVTRKGFCRRTIDVFHVTCALRARFCSSALEFRKRFVLSTSRKNVLLLTESRRNFFKQGLLGARY